MARRRKANAANQSPHPAIAGAHIRHYLGLEVGMAAAEPKMNLDTNDITETFRRRRMRFFCHTGGEKCRQEQWVSAAAPEDPTANTIDRPPEKSAP
jgi:hypothetical protein